MTVTFIFPHIHQSQALKRGWRITISIVHLNLSLEHFFYKKKKGKLEYVAGKTIIILDILNAKSTNVDK